MDDLELDIRPILHAGGEPFAAIMGAVADLAAGQRLRLRSTFRPDPLFRVMAGRGFSHEAREIGAGDWLVVFTPITAESRPSPQSDPDSPETWPDPAFYLDCTEPDSPEPMSRILGRLDTMNEGQVLFALLEGEPLALFPALTAGGHAFVGDFDENHEAYRLMVRAGH